MEPTQDLFAGINAFALAGYGLMSLFVFTAISHWIAYLQDFRPELRKGLSFMTDLEALFRTLESQQVPTQQRPGRLKKHLGRSRGEQALQRHPVFRVFDWLIQGNKHRRNPQVLLERLDTEIAAHFGDALKECNRNKGLAPVFGLFFTVTGIIFAAHRFAGGAAQTELLGDVGVALGTTAMGALTVILERYLIESCLLPQALGLRNRGQRLLLDTLENLSARPQALHRSASLPAPREARP